MRILKYLRSGLFLLLVFTLSACPGSSPAEHYDLVIRGGRVIDPETQADRVSNIGILGGAIAAVSESELQGDRIIDATGLVVAPGFIDLHAHGQSDEAFRLMVLDGVTSALELEVGTAAVDRWYQDREGGQLLNYGVSAGHIPVRMLLFDDPGEFLPAGQGGRQPASDEQIEQLAAMLRQGLREGAVAVGFGLAYTPATTTREFETMLNVANEFQAGAHIHVRGSSSGVEGAVEAIEAAGRTKTPLHIVHANSSGGEAIAEFLSRIELARNGGQDVTTEAYPYEAGMTSIQSALFDDWESWDDARFQMHQWAATGERLTRESFGRYREQGGEVIIHSRTEEMTRTAIGHPLTMIASDGFIEGGKGHPRTAGTYSRVLGRYVRQEGLLPLMDALRRMTIEPARRLQARVAGMARKGRLQTGSDADIVVFDPSTVIDQATYENPIRTSSGFRYVFVNGVPVVDDGNLVEGARPGRAIRAEVR